MIEIPEQRVLEQIAKVASEDGEPLNATHVVAVLAAYRAILSGDPLGVIRRNPETGEIAHRVNQDGLHMWRISHQDGTQYNDLQPTLDWPRID